MAAGGHLRACREMQLHLISSQQLQGQQVGDVRLADAQDHGVPVDAVSVALQLHGRGMRAARSEGEVIQSWDGSSEHACTRAQKTHIQCFNTEM